MENTVIYAILFLFCVIGIVCILYIVFRIKKQDTFESRNEPSYLTIENHTQVVQKVNISDNTNGVRSIIIQPYKSGVFIEKGNEHMIETELFNFDGNVTKYSAIIFNNKKKNRTFILTYHGIYGDNNEIFRETREGKLRNSSGFPVIFVEYGANGRRWPTAVISPGSSVVRLIVSQTKWEIVHPSDENNPLASVYVPPNTSSLIFDGKNIITLADK